MSHACKQLGELAFDLARDIVEANERITDGIDYYVESSSAQFEISVGPIRGKWKMTLERVDTDTKATENRPIGVEFYPRIHEAESGSYKGTKSINWTCAEGATIFFRIYQPDGKVNQYSCPYDWLSDKGY